MQWKTKHTVLAAVVLALIVISLMLFNQMSAILKEKNMKWWHWMILLVFIFAVVISVFFQQNLKKC